MTTKKTKKLFSILFVPFLFLLVMWIVKIIEYYFQYSLTRFGVFPKTISGLKGVLFSLMLKRRLRYPIFETPFHCTQCDETMDIYGDHALVCSAA